MHKPKDLPDSYFELLRRIQVQKKTGLSKSGIYSGLRNNTFPKPVKIGPRAVAWRKNEVNEWVGNRTSVDCGENNDG
jgi:prophage regulatory protein